MTTISTFTNIKKLVTVYLIFDYF